MKNVANGLARYGRNGDNNLVHVSNRELRGLEQLTGRKFTQNPHTGLPEAFGWSDLIPIAAGVAGTVLSGGNPVVGGLASGAARAAVTTAEGGSAEKALTQGLISGVTSYAGGELMAGVGGAAGAGAQGATTAATQVVPGAGGAVITEPLGAVGGSAATTGVQGASAAIPAQAGAGLPSIPLAPEVALPTPGLSDNLASAGTRIENIFSEPGQALSRVAQNVKASPGTAAIYLGGSALQAQDMLYGQPKIPGEIPYDPGKYPEQFPTNRRQWNAPSADYRPGYSPEYRYFAKGGLASLRPEGNTTENLMNEAKAALLGEHPKPREAIERFRDVFGDGALQSLRDRLVGGRVRGAGGGLDDLVPGDIEGRQRVRLADGEFVLPSHIVSAIGDGSTDQGVRRLHEMMDSIYRQKYKSNGNPKPLKKGTLVHEWGD